MTLNNKGRVQLFEPGHRIKLVVPAVDKEVGDIEQEAAPPLFTKPVEEIRLFHVSFYAKMRGDVLEQNGPIAILRQLPGMFDNPVKTLPARNDRVEMAQVDLRGPGKSDMLADPLRPGDLHHGRERFKRLLVERPGRSKREPEAMNKEGVTFGEPAEIVMAAIKEVFSGDLQAFDRGRHRLDPA